MSNQNAHIIAREINDHSELLSQQIGIKKGANPDYNDTELYYLDSGARVTKFLSEETINNLISSTVIGGSSGFYEASNFEELKSVLESVLCPIIRIMKPIIISTTETIEFHTPYKTWSEAGNGIDYNPSAIIYGERIEIESTGNLVFNAEFHQIPNLVFENHVILNNGVLGFLEFDLASSTNGVVYLKGLFRMYGGTLYQTDSEDRVFLKNVTKSGGGFGPGIRVAIPEDDSKGATLNETDCVRYNNIYGHNGTEIDTSLTWNSSYYKINSFSECCFVAYVSSPAGRVVNLNNCYDDGSNLRYTSDGYASYTDSFNNGSTFRVSYTYNNGTSGSIVTGVNTVENIAW